jgi:hypothetical protein
MCYVCTAQNISVNTLAARAAIKRCHSLPFAARGAAFCSAITITPRSFIKTLRYSMIQSSKTIIPFFPQNHTHSIVVIVSELSAFKRGSFQISSARIWFLETACKNTGFSFTIWLIRRLGKFRLFLGRFSCLFLDYFYVKLRLFLDGFEEN